jgi:hypothetical protein
MSGLPFLFQGTDRNEKERWEKRREKRREKEKVEGKDAVFMWGYVEQKRGRRQTRSGPAYPSLEVRDETKVLSSFGALSCFWKLASTMGGGLIIESVKSDCPGVKGST